MKNIHFLFLKNKRGDANSDSIGMFFVGLGVFVIVLWFIGYLFKDPRSNEYILGMGGQFILLGAIFVLFGIRSSLARYKTTKDIAQKINADKVHWFLDPVTFIGIHNGNRYKVTFSESLQGKWGTKPSKLSVYIYLNKSTSNLNLFIKNKDYPSSLWNRLFLKKLDTELEAFDGHYVVRANNLDEAMKILLNDEKRKMLLLFLGMHFGIELNRKYICLTQVGGILTRMDDENNYKIEEAISKSHEFAKLF